MSSQNEEKKVLVYADGVYDMFHHGHSNQLRQAKTRHPNTKLLVGVSGQEETEKLKGKTIMTGEERGKDFHNYFSDDD